MRPELHGLVVVVVVPRLLFWGVDGEKSAVFVVVEVRGVPEERGGVAEVQGRQEAARAGEFDGGVVEGAVAALVVAEAEGREAEVFVGQTARPQVRAAPQQVGLGADEHGVVPFGRGQLGRQARAEARGAEDAAGSRGFRADAVQQAVRRLGADVDLKPFGRRVVEAQHGVVSVDDGAEAGMSQGAARRDDGARSVSPALRLDARSSARTSARLLARGLVRRCAPGPMRAFLRGVATRDLLAEGRHVEVLKTSVVRARLLHARLLHPRAPPPQRRPVPLVPHHVLAPRRRLLRRPLPRLLPLQDGSLRRVPRRRGPRHREERRQDHGKPAAHHELTAVVAAGP
mmetsp:Transcript_22398/g.68978  ORF Transcript_22398/g.68978 Transcript_22398/m.68978 type:complete len:343 (+) Transcript_22398:298-1326(+)